MLARLERVLSLRSVLTCLALMPGVAVPALSDTIDPAAAMIGCAPSADPGGAGCGVPVPFEQFALLGRALPGGGVVARRVVPVAKVPSLPAPAPAPQAADPPAGSVLEGLGPVMDRLMAIKRHSFASIRPVVWRVPVDLVAPPQDLPRLADFARVGNRLQPPAIWLAGAPGGAVGLRRTQGFDGLRLTDFAFLPLLAQRVLMTRFYPGELAEVRLWWADAIVPLAGGPVLRPVLPYPLSPFPRSTDRVVPDSRRPTSVPPLPPIAPVPVAPAGLLLASAIGAAAGLRALGKPRRGRVRGMA